MLRDLKQETKEKTETGNNLYFLHVNVYFKTIHSILANM